MAVLDLRPFSAGATVRNGARPSFERRALDSWMESDCSSAFVDDAGGSLDVFVFVLFITRGLRPSSFRSLLVSPIDKSMTSSDISIFQRSYRWMEIELTL